MMTLVVVITTLNAAIGIVKGAKELLDMLNRGNVPKPVGDAIAQLPAAASAAQIVEAAERAMSGVGGSLFVSAGDDGGGTARIAGASMKAGDGRRKGGDAVFKAGDGGMHGPGGDLIIEGGTYSGGNATGGDDD